MVKKRKRSDGCGLTAQFLMQPPPVYSLRQEMFDAFALVSEFLERDVDTLF